MSAVDEATVENSRQRKVASPRKNQSRADRPKERVPVSGFRDILTVRGKDPDYEYRWVKDGDEQGQRILLFIEAGYQLVQAEEVKNVGQNMVYSTSNVGSIVRAPAGQGLYLYLMKIPKEWYDEDQAAKQGAIDEQEQELVRDRNMENDDGQYGKGTLSTSLRRRVEA